MLMIIKVVYEILKYLLYVNFLKEFGKLSTIQNMDGTWKANFESFFNIVAHFQLAFNLSKVGALTLFFRFQKMFHNLFYKQKWILLYAYY